MYLNLTPELWGKIEVAIIEQSMGDAKYGIFWLFWHISEDIVIKMSLFQKEGLKELTFKVNIDYEN